MSLQNVTHATTAQLSCHVQYFIAIDPWQLGWEENEISIEIELRWKTRSWNGPGASLSNYKHVKLLDVFSHPCPNINGGLTKLPLKLRHEWVNTSKWDNTSKYWLLLISVDKDKRLGYAKRDRVMCRKGVCSLHGNMDMCVFIEDLINILIYNICVYVSVRECQWQCCRF